LADTLSLRAHQAYLEAAVAAAKAAPLSQRKAMLAVMLADAFADHRFAAEAAGGDILAFRAALAARSEALALVFAIAAHRPDGAQLFTEAVTIPIAEYGSLRVEDFMVSLYNSHTVQRVRIVTPDGTRHDVHVVLAEALKVLSA
jgi:hypothetical protein